MPTFQPTDPRDFAQLLKEGEYLFEVKRAEDGVGKQSGDAYLKLSLAVFHDDKETIVTDYLSFGPKAHKKLWGFCQSTGTENCYHKGQIDKLSVEGLSGRLHLCVQEQEGFEPKNAVAYYKRPKRIDTARPLPKLESTPLNKPDEDESLPF